MHVAKPYFRAILIFFIMWSCRIGLMEVMWCSIFQGIQGSHDENAVRLRKDQAQHTPQSFA